MAWGTITAEFYNFAGVSQGTIATVYEASGANKRSRVGKCSVTLPRILTSTEWGYIIDGGICRAYVDYSGTQKNICTFVISHRETVKRGHKHYLQVSGYSQLTELSFRNADGILSATFTGSVVSASINSIQFDSAVGSTDLTGWIANITAGASAPQGVVIDSYVVGTRTATLKYNWYNGVPGAGETYVVNGGAVATDDLDQFSTLWLSPTGWTMEVEGAATGTADGSLMFFVGETALQGLVDLSDGSGEWFRAKTFTPSDRTVEWRTTADASGVTLSSTETADGIILDLTEDYDHNIVTRVYPGGAGLSSNQVNLSGATHTLPSGFSYTSDPTSGIVNDTLESAGSGGVEYVSQYPNWTHIQPATDSAEALLAAKNQLAKQSVQYLQARSGARKFYRIRAVLVTDVKPGQTIAISYTAPGFNPYTISESGLYIQEVNYSVGQDGTNKRIADLLLTETLTPLPDSADAVANDFKRLQNTIKRSGAPGSGGAGGAGGSGVRLTLDSNADTFLSLTDTTAVLQTLGVDSQTANTIFAAPNGSDGVPTFRALVENDLPALTPSFLTLATSTRLTNERVLTAGTGIGFVDTGANGTLTVSVNESGFSTPGTLSVSSANASGANHTHAITSSSDTSGGGSSLLKSDSNGDLKLRRANVTSRYEMNGLHILSLQGTALFVANSAGIGTITTGYGIVAIGDQAASSVTSANNILAIGSYSLASITTQAQLIAIGASAGQFSTNSQSIFIGVNAGAYQTGSLLTVIGDGAASGSGTVSVAASSSVVIGTEAAKFFSGSGMVAIGNYAIYTATSGGNSAINGSQAAYNATSIADSTVIGFAANYSNTSLSGVVSIGAFANYSHAGSMAGSVFIGNYAGYYETSNFRLHISVSPTTNPLIYGEFGNTLVRLAAVTVEIGDGTNATTLRNRVSDLTLDVEGGQFYIDAVNSVFNGTAVDSKIETDSPSVITAVDGSISVSNQSLGAHFNAFVYTSNPTNYFPAVRLRAGRGNRTTTTASQGDDNIGRFGAAGYDGTSFPSGCRGFMQVNAGSTWTGSNHETYLQFATTSNASTTPAVRMTIKDQVLVNSSTVDTQGDRTYATIFQVKGGAARVVSDGGDAHLNMVTYNNTTAAAGGAVRFRRTRGSLGTPSAVQSGDLLGRVGAAGYGTTGFKSTYSTGYMDFIARENFNDTSNGTRIVFYTTANGSLTAAERFRISPSGISTDGGVNRWRLGGFTSAADAASNGYVSVIIEGTTYKLNTRA